MATRLSDLPIVDEVATRVIINRSLAANAFVNSGVMQRDAELDAFLNANIGGKTVAPRFIGPLAQNDANISSDDPTDKSTPDKITGGANKAVRQSLNKCWSSMDLAAALLGEDPVGAITHLRFYHLDLSHSQAFAALSVVHLPAEVCFR